jgi:hypothetical protein
MLMLMLFVTPHYIKNVSADGLIMYPYAFDYFHIIKVENAHVKNFNDKYNCTVLDY